MEPVPAISSEYSPTEGQPPFCGTATVDENKPVASKATAAAATAGCHRAGGGDGGGCTSANERERARMRVLSSAFVRLKGSLPWVPPDTKLSKLDTLRLASRYIAYLRRRLRLATARQEELEEEEKEEDDGDTQENAATGSDRRKEDGGNDGSVRGGLPDRFIGDGPSSRCRQLVSELK